MRLRHLLWIIVSLLLLPLIMGGMIFAWFWWITPNPAPLRKTNPQTTSFIQQHCQTGDCSLNWVPLSAMSPFLPQAVVAAEDIRFFFHGWIDWTNIKTAMKINLDQRRIVWGGSTLTQQLAKNLYLGREKTIGRKIRELVLTWKLEKALPKERILELYLNVAQWGPSVYGVGNASRLYFGKSPRELGPLEASYLASILPNPELAEGEAFRERFAEAGSRIFDFLVRSYLPPVQEVKTSEPCSSSLDNEERGKTDYLVAKIFSEFANEILSGKASLLNTEDIEKLLSPEEWSFLQKLVGRARELRPIRPISCRRPDGDAKSSLAPIKQPSPLYGNITYWIPLEARDAVTTLLQESRAARVPLVITSAYRGAGYQLYLLLTTLRQDTYCLSTTLKRVALPEESEHACLDRPAVDFGSLGGDPIPFEESPAYRWLTQVAPRTGFTLSYPEGGTTGLMFEPWHWRWEGKN